MNHNQKKNGVLLLKTRKKIYEVITKFPAIHFRELQRKTDLATGNLEHHLRYLRKFNLINLERTKGHSRFYPVGLDVNEIKLLGILRQKKFRDIILLLLKKKTLNHGEILDILKMGPSTTSWYLKKLVEYDILSFSLHGKMKFFFIKKKHKICKILISYKESFVDKLVDRFVETWET